ncbi:hypothetical protein [Agromyces humi]|uniref:hypothetical protein n=1 Tax=Agromyces humi TaxID=1766800 RepID=UPI001358A8C6|nr:hypothetical protein [Agromyces humi]
MTKTETTIADQFTDEQYARFGKLVLISLVASEENSSSDLIDSYGLFQESVFGTDPIIPFDETEEEVRAQWRELADRYGIEHDG